MSQKRRRGRSQTCSREAACVHFTRGQLCLIVPRRPVAPPQRVRPACAAAVIFISPIKNHFFFFFFQQFFFFSGFTPFHPVIETSAFALISRPETAEGVNQCPITRANRVKGGGGRRGGGGGRSSANQLSHHQAGESIWLRSFQTASIHQ